MIKTILLIAIVILIVWLWRRFKNLPANEKKPKLIKVLLVGIFGLSILAVATGKMHWLGALLAGFAAFAKFGLLTAFRAMPLFNFLRRSSVFKNPEFKTPFLHLRVDLKNGQLDGEVIDGPHKGKPLAALMPDELAELEEHYRERDKRSYFLIRVIRQRAGQAKSGGDHKQDYSNMGNPDLEEALQILGLEGKPSKDDVIKAHRRLMQKLHPDRGGNDYLASRVNLAKETILRHIEK